MMYVGRKLCLLFVLTILVQGCGFLKETIFSNQPDIIFSNPTANIFTNVSTTSFTWDTYDASGQLRTVTQPYQIIVFQGPNCTGSILGTTEQLATTFVLNSMVSGNKYSIRVNVVYDDAGNLIGKCSQTVHMDNQAPGAPTFTAPAAGPTYNITGTYNFVWTAPADPGASGISYYIVNGYAMAGCAGGVVVGPSTQATLTYSWAGLSDATSYSIDVTPVDNAGNVGAATCTTPRYVYVDLTAPTVNCNNMTPGWYTTASMPLALSGSCADAESGCNVATLQCRYSADNGTSWGAWGACSQSWADSTSGAGSKFEMRERDFATNLTTSGQCDIQVDKTAPPAPTITSSPPALTNSTSWNFMYNSVDPVSGTASYDCRVDGGAWVIGCGTNYNTGVLPAGAHTFDTRAIDTAGNTSANASYAWSIDTVLPVCTITQYGNFDGAATYWTNNTNPTVNFTCTDDSGAVSAGTLECSIDGGAWGACSGVGFAYPNGSFNMGGALGDGPHTAQVRVQDASTNQGTSAAMSYTIDTVLPAPNCNGQTAVAWKNAATPMQTYGACTDADSGCVPASLTCSFDGGSTWIACAQAVAAIPEGDPVTYSVQSADYAGNTNTNAACQYKLDRTIPTVTAAVTSACGDTSVNPILAGYNYDLTPTASDGLSGLNTLTCDGAGCATGVPYTVAGGSAATVTSIPIVATDNAGNSDTYNMPVYVAGSGLASTTVAPSGGGWVTTNPVLTTTLNVGDGNANNWAVGTSLQVSSESVCVTTPLSADQWTVGADTAKQKTTGNYGLDGKRKTRTQLTDACGNSTAMTAYSATTDLDWQNPVTNLCNVTCDASDNISVDYNATDPAASCSAGDESGVANSYVELDGSITSPAQAAGGTYIFPAAGSGPHSVKCYALDNAGNDNRVNDTALTGTQFMTSGVVCP